MTSPDQVGELALKKAAAFDRLTNWLGWRSQIEWDSEATPDELVEFLMTRIGLDLDLASDVRSGRRRSNRTMKSRRRE